MFQSYSDSMLAEAVAGAVFLVVLIAEFLHLRRVRQIAPLAFGPSLRPSAWAMTAPLIRVLAVSAVAWALVTLLIIKPKSFRPEGQIQPGKEQHLMLVLDVSPSMRLPDAGPSGDQSRKERGRDLMRSLFERLPADMFLVSTVAVYNGAKPVVVDSRDMDVIDGVLGDLPLYQAFLPGQTRLLEGLRTAAEIAKPWNPRSTTIIMISDGDTVPPQGMPRMPASVGDVMVVGVGDPTNGSFIEGRQSKQDAFMLRQIATRLQGNYHDGNREHLPSLWVDSITDRGTKQTDEPWTRREYALMACLLGSFSLVTLPHLLHNFGTTYRPGVRRHPKSDDPGGDAANETRRQ
ncbi:MAG: vWA domain-containing protein [Planctomycetota bacterium]